MTLKQIETVFESKLDRMADPDCESCEGTGLVADVLEGDNRPCFCVEEYKAELRGEAAMDAANGN